MNGQVDFPSHQELALFLLLAPILGRPASLHFTSLHPPTLLTIDTRYHIPQINHVINYSTNIHVLLLIANTESEIKIRASSVWTSTDEDANRISTSKEQQFTGTATRREL